ncbi:MAG: hypothetical protein A4E38_00068 [Methanoregulaceae archaeon PtaB.Bin108]|nr:MAG: hypothetical protein A4E38_00068 [Methanoregulaceae archaeon PtaB.Bin108]
MTDVTDGPPPAPTGSGSRMVTVIVAYSILLSRYFNRPSMRSISTCTRSICCCTSRISETFLAISMIRWYWARWFASAPRRAWRSTYSSVTSSACTDWDRTVPSAAMDVSARSKEAAGTRMTREPERRSPRYRSSESEPMYPPFPVAMDCRASRAAITSFTSRSTRAVLRIF